MPFRIALSGLDAASTDLQVTGNNIANAATAGFKESRAEFADLYASSLNDVSTNSSGRGVRVSRVAQQFSQGNIDFTGSNLDLSISGEGLFILGAADGSASYEYTRAGAFSVDRDSYVVNHAGQQLQFFPAQLDVNGNVVKDASGSPIFQGAISSIQLPTQAGAPSATASIVNSVNLDSNEAQPAAYTAQSAVPPAALVATEFSPNPSPDEYNHTTSTTLYDSLGNSHIGTFYYVKTSVPGQWNVYLQTTNNEGTDVFVPADQSRDGTVDSYYTTLQFDGTGSLVSAGTSGPPYVTSASYPGFDLHPSTALTGDAAAMNLDIDFGATTQYGTRFAINNLTQDGYTSGLLTGLDIDKSGVAFARFSNGQSLALGMVALARFNNQQGLLQVGDTNWAESFASGGVQVGQPGTSSLGLVQSGALESSNVDVAEQLVNLISAQRNFQANAQVISATDTITQTVINMIR
ncbi:MAG: flagellar hook protein FlgE [Candidatus Polarisedimenticolaceae bacterium]|nr:flagellar hook protein FlgE [Candidatus Polarisedimenticolaceae bacterium]